MRSDADTSNDRDIRRPYTYVINLRQSSQVSPIVMIGGSFRPGYHNARFGRLTNKPPRAASTMHSAPAVSHSMVGKSRRYKIGLAFGYPTEG